MLYAQNILKKIITNMMLSGLPLAQSADSIFSLSFVSMPIILSLLIAPRKLGI